MDRKIKISDIVKIISLNKEGMVISYPINLETGKREKYVVNTDGIDGKDYLCEESDLIFISTFEDDINAELFKDVHAKA